MPFGTVTNGTDLRLFVVISMGDVLEQVSWLIEQGILFWSSFSGSWFDAVGSLWNIAAGDEL